MNIRFLFNILAVGSMLIIADIISAQSSSVSDSVQQVKLLMGSNLVSQVVAKIMPQLKQIYCTTTNTPEKMEILNYLAEKSITRNGDNDEDRFKLLEYAVDNCALIQSSNKTGVWAGNVLRRFVNSANSDSYKALALKKLMGLQVLGGDQQSAKNSLEDLVLLTRSSQDVQLSKQRAAILTEALGGFSEGIQNPKEQARWLEDRLLRLLKEKDISPEDKCAFTIGLGDAYSYEGTEDKVRAAKALFFQAKKETSNTEQKLECLHMISYCCYQLAEYSEAIAAIEEMMPMVSILPGQSQASGSQTLAQAIWSAENAFRHNKKWNKLVEIRGTVVNQYEKHLPPGQIFYFSVENGRDAKMAGDTKGAVVWYDRAITSFPSSGWDDVNLKSAGWNESSIVSLNLEKINACYSTNRSERIKTLEAVWDRYGSNEWITTYNLGVNLGYEYSAAKDKRGKQFLSDLLNRIESHPTKGGSSDAQDIATMEESCLIKLALWYDQDKETAQAQATFKKYLAKYPNGNNAVTAKEMLSGTAGKGSSPRKENTGRRIIVLSILATLTFVLIAIMTRKNFYSSRPSL